MTTVATKRRSPRRAAIAALALALAAAPRAARAEPAAAEAMFQEGRRLLKAGDVDQACAMFDESQRLDPAPGTLLNVADCHERQGKLATAWAEFLSVAQSASRRGNEKRAAEAERRAARLAPTLSYLTVVVAGADVAGLSVTRNGEPLRPAQFGVRVPVDPAEYVITAQAPEHQGFRASVRITPGGESKTVEVPALLPDPAAGPVAPPAPAAVAPRREAAGRAPAASGGRPALGYVAVGAGVALLGAGVAFGLMAKETYERAEGLCDDAPGACSPAALPEARDERAKALTQAWASNVGIGLGLAGLAAGAYVLFFAPAKASPSAGARAGVSIGAAPGGLAVRF